MPRIYITSVFVDDLAKALDFYTNTLGFTAKVDLDLGGARWLTVVGDDPDGTQLLLEPDQHPAAAAYKKALVADGIPATSFQVEDVEKTRTELEAKGVSIVSGPVSFGPNTFIVIDDTCGNLIQLIQGPVDGAAQ